MHITRCEWAAARLSAPDWCTFKSRTSVASLRHWSETWEYILSRLTRMSHAPQWIKVQVASDGLEKVDMTLLVKRIGALWGRTYENATKHRKNQSIEPNCTRRASDEEKAKQQNGMLGHGHAGKPKRKQPGKHYPAYEKTTSRKDEKKMEKKVEKKSKLEGKWNMAREARKKN